MVLKEIASLTSTTSSNSISPWTDPDSSAGGRVLARGELYGG